MFDVKIPTHEWEDILDKVNKYGKWKYISELLSELYIYLDRVHKIPHAFTLVCQLMQIANRINDILRDKYGELSTTVWIKDFITIHKFIKDILWSFTPLESKAIVLISIIRAIAGNAEYCIACVCSIDCYKCTFAEVAGRCSDPNSIYTLFIESLSALYRSCIWNVDVILLD